MAATVRVSYFGASASEPAGANAEAGITFNREDTINGTTGVVPIPNSSGTNYSWKKNLALEVTGTGATSLSNRKISLASGATTGLTLHYLATGTYSQPSSGNKPTDNGTTNDATPATYTLVSTTPAVYDSGSNSAGSTGRNGQFCVMVLGVSNLFAGGGGSASLPNLTFTYDES